MAARARMEQQLASQSEKLSDLCNWKSDLETRFT
jgi:hypothetical protein